MTATAAENQNRPGQPPLASVSWGPSAARATCRATRRCDPFLAGRLGAPRANTRKRLRAPLVAPLLAPRAAAYSPVLEFSSPRWVRFSSPRWSTFNPAQVVHFSSGLDTVGTRAAAPPGRQPGDVIVRECQRNRVSAVGLLAGARSGASLASHPSRSAFPNDGLRQSVSPAGGTRGTQGTHRGGTGGFDPGSALASRSAGPVATEASRIPDVTSTSRGLAKSSRSTVQGRQQRSITWLPRWGKGRRASDGHSSAGEA